ncbi:hypothetical protein [Subtercola boreus]|uniref:Bulb-type lectin domain-containing protein n=1 Tax=Subtercola boreus TaxID=120213 RepID=A0A3E0W7N3_9MICO|nr:hypothetical protein [Subtercola boreus]RFA17913.1 hypothetical protein B7R24_14690 [Subtercola boreus]RFA18295.1 hypothetical protein B7R23_14725 [Subtercola boreus]RFA24825.1 hypothetical protein B7R25_14720 [Subtercola boreus]
MKKTLRAFVAAPLISATLLAGALVPQAAHADGTLAEYKWSSDSGFTEFGLGAFWVESRTDNSKLVFQTDGNLVLYADSGRAVWQSRTYGRGAAKISLQSDGNVVVYRADNVALWASGVSRFVPTGTWSMVLLGTPGAPTITERNRLSGGTDFWRIP